MQTPYRIRQVACFGLALAVLWGMAATPAGAQDKKEVPEAVLKDFSEGSRALEAGDKRIEAAARSLAKTVAFAKLTRTEADGMFGAPPWGLEAVLEKLEADGSGRFDAAHLADARKALTEAKAHYGRAVAAAGQVRQAAPDLVDAPILRGMGLLGQGQIEEALAALEKAQGMGVDEVRILQAGRLADALAGGVTADRLPEIAVDLAYAMRRPALGSLMSRTAGYQFGYGAAGVTFEFDEAQVAKLAEQEQEMDLFGDLLAEPAPAAPKPEAQVAEPASEAQDQAAAADATAGEIREIIKPEEVQPITPIAIVPSQPQAPLKEAPEADETTRVVEIAPKVDAEAIAKWEALEAKADSLMAAKQYTDALAAWQELPEDRQPAGKMKAAEDELAARAELERQERERAESLSDLSEGQQARLADLAKEVSEEDSLNARRALELGRRALLQGRNVPSVAEASAEAEARLNTGLQANKVTRIVLEEMFEFPAPLNGFLEQLEKKFEYKEFSFVKDRYWLVSSKLETANKNFEQAIALHPRLLDAYFEKIRISLDMDWRTEVIRLYETARLLPIETLTPEPDRGVFDLDPLGPVVEQAMFRVAGIYYEEQDLVRDIRRTLENAGQPAVQAETAIDSTAEAQEPEAIRLIQKFMADRSAILDQYRPQVEGNEEMMTALDNQEIWNRFVLTRFYREIGWKDQADRTFEKEKQKLGPKLTFERERYGFVSAELDQLERQIASMKQTVTVNFQVLGDLVSKLGMRAKAAFFPQAASANIPVSTEDLEIRMIPGRRSDVAFKKEVATDLVTSQSISLPEGLYTVRVELPVVPLQKENEFPLRFVHMFRNAQFPRYLQPGLQMKITDEKGVEQEIILPNGQYTQAAGALVDAEGNQVTFPAGTAQVSIAVDLDYLSDWGSLFAFNIEKPGDLKIRGQEEALERVSKGLVGAIVLMFFVL